jgi:hypothetical protein
MKSTSLIMVNKKEFIMTQPIFSKKRANSIFFALLLIGSGFALYSGRFIPGIILAIGIPLALRQFLLGKFYDVFVTIFIFLGAFITSHFKESSTYILPIIFTLSGIYIFFRDYIENITTKEVDVEEDLNEEIEEQQHPK